MSLNANLTEQVKFVEGLLNTVPSSSTPDYISLKYFERVCILISVKNGTGVSGSAITLKQAKSVAGDSEKPLTFTKALRNLDTAASDIMAEFEVAGSTFTTDATGSKNLMYAMEVKAEELDVNGGFDCIRAGTADATAASVTVLYLMFGPKISTCVPVTVD